MNKLQDARASPTYVSREYMFWCIFVSEGSFGFFFIYFIFNNLLIKGDVMKRNIQNKMNDSKNNTENNSVKDKKLILLLLIDLLNLFQKSYKNLEKDS